MLGIRTVPAWATGSMYTRAGIVMPFTTVFRSFPSIINTPPAVWLAFHNSRAIVKTKGVKLDPKDGFVLQNRPYTDGICAKCRQFSERESNMFMITKYFYSQTYPCEIRAKCRRHTRLGHFPNVSPGNGGYHGSVAKKER